MIKIQSISDIITNSSSEVFIIDTNKHAEVSKFIEDICNIFGVNVNDIIEFESATKDGGIYGWDAKYKKGNLLVWSKGENSIPFPILDLITNLIWADHLPAIEKMNIKTIDKIHLG